MLCICVLCGLPGSGKTTLSQHLISNSNNEIEFIHVCYDNLIPHINYNQTNNIGKWKESRKHVINQVNTVLQNYKTSNFETTEAPYLIFQQQLIKSEAQIKVLLFDDNMYYRGMRKEVYNLCCEHGIGFCVVYVQCSVDICSARNAVRQHEDGVNENTIYKMKKQFEVPNKNQHSWEKYSIVASSERTIFLEHATDIVNIIRTAIKDPAKKPNLISKEGQQSKELIQKNFKHQLDIILRKFIHSTMSQAKTTMDKEELKHLFKQINTAKENVFNYVDFEYLNGEDFVGNDGNVAVDLLQEKIFLLMNNFLDQ